MKNIFSSCLIFTFIITISHFTTAQNKMRIIEMEREAEANFNAKSFHTALPIFKILDSLKPKNQNYLYKLGVCYVAIDDNLNAVKYLEQCLKNSDSHPAAFNYYLGRAYHLSHRLDDAIVHYSLYQQEFKNNNSKSSQQLVKEVERDIRMCEIGKELMAKPLALDIVNLGTRINTQYPEYAPIISADESELIFTSNRPNTTGGDIDDFDGLYFEDVYISYKKGGTWTEPIQLSTNINTDGHDASIALSPDGQTMFIYRFDQQGTSSKPSGDIFTSKLEGKVWSKAERLSNKINTIGWEPSASITEDGKTLYFTSDKPGGKGGTDIYISKKLSDGNWDTPQNISNNINTEFDEDCPFIHPDGKTLYFSSKGHNSMGGFDIFISTFNSEKKEWSTPENFGYPVSTAHDDLNFVISANAKRIYFSSIRNEGHGNKDIYYANIDKKESAKVLLITGIVSDSSTGKPVEVTIRVKDNTNDEELESHTSNSATGKYTIVLNEGKNYDLTFTSPKFGTHYENVNLTDIKEYKEINKNIVLKQRNRNVIFNVSDNDTKNKTNATITAKNIDSEEEIKLNEESGLNGVYFIKLKEGNLYSIDVNKTGFVFHNTKISVPTKEQNEQDTLKYNIKLQPIKEGAVIILKSIYFASDESVPLSTSLVELDRLAVFLKQNPGAAIEVSAHTDNDGSDDYNLKLSEKRAKEVVNYLTQKGISSTRMKYKGYGKSQPLTKGNSEQDKQTNRRVELKILKVK